MEVTIYIFKDCPQCQQVKQMLTEKGIKYTECRDPIEMEAHRIKQTPALRVPVGPNEYKVLTNVDDVMRWFATLK